MDWFNKHLANELCDGYGEFETEEVNITDEYELERTALDIQREINFRRLHSIRRLTTNNEYITIEQFEHNCREVVDLLDENKAITDRIVYIESIQHLSQLA